MESTMLVYIYERKHFEEWPGGVRPVSPKVYPVSAVLINKPRNNNKGAK